jgi:hypothetical protein
MDINFFFIAAQVVGVIEFVFNVIGNLKMTTKKILIYNSICSALAILQYCLLGAWAGIACCAAVIIRNIIFSRYKKKIPVSILLLFIAVAIALNIPTIHNVFDALLLANIVAYSIALWTKNVLAIKVVGLATCFTCAAYNYVNGAFAAILSNAVIAIVYIRCIYDLKMKTISKFKQKR